MIIGIKDDDITFIKDEYIFKINIDKRTFISSKIFNFDEINRDFIIENEYIYCRDLNNLYKISLDKLEVLKNWKLGLNQSPICSIKVDDQKIYALMENGLLYVINENNDIPIYYKISNYKLYSLAVNDVLYIGDEKGQILIIDKNSYQVIDRIKIHDKAIISILVDENYLYTASKDLSIKIINLNDYITIKSIKPHNNPFIIVGVYNNLLITTSTIDDETKLWSLPDLHLSKIYKFSSSNMIIDNEYLYFDQFDDIRYLNLISSSSVNYQDEITDININGITNL